MSWAWRLCQARLQNAVCADPQRWPPPTLLSLPDLLNAGAGRPEVDEEEMGGACAGEVLLVFFVMFSASPYPFGGNVRGKSELAPLFAVRGQDRPAHDAPNGHGVGVGPQVQEVGLCTTVRSCRSA